MPLSHQSNADRLLYEAVRLQDPAGVSSALQDGADANLTVIVVQPSHRVVQPSNAVPHSMLQLACNNYGRQNFAIIENLVTHGADVNAGQGEYYGPPIFCVCRGLRVDTDAVRLLLQSGANPNGADYRGTTALHLTANDGDLEIFRLLLEYGGDLESADSFQATLLHHACDEASESLQTVQEMVHFGANIFKRDRDRRTPLDFACSLLSEFQDAQLDEEEDDPDEEEINNCKAVIEFLLRRGSEILFERDPRLFLHSLIREQGSFIQPNSVVLPVGAPDLELGVAALDDLVARNPAALRCRDENGYLPVHLACQCGVNAETMAFLVEWDTETLHICDASEANNLPIHMVAGGQSAHPERLDVLKVLVEHGGAAAMLGARNAQGYQQLHLLLLSWSKQNKNSAKPKGGKGANDDDDEENDALLLRMVDYMVASHPNCVSAKTRAGDLPVTLAAAAGASLGVVFTLLRGDPAVVPSP